MEKFNYDAIDVFVFEPEAEAVTWIYYNPDADAGGQYVETVFSFDTALQGNEKCSETGEDFFVDYISGVCQTYLYDLGEDCFEAMDIYFKEQTLILGTSIEKQKYIMDRIKEYRQEKENASW